MAADLIRRAASDPDADGAARSLATMADRLPRSLSAAATAGQARLLRPLGRFDEADAPLAAALATAPEAAVLVEEYVATAVAREAWMGALARLQKATRDFPNHISLRLTLYEVQTRIGGSQCD